MGSILWLTMSQLLQLTCEVKPADLAVDEYKMNTELSAESKAVLCLVNSPIYLFAITALL